jgi:hypothetical protein
MHKSGILSYNNSLSFFYRALVTFFGSVFRDFTPSQTPYLHDNMGVNPPFVSIFEIFPLSILKYFDLEVCLRIFYDFLRLCWSGLIGLSLPFGLFSNFVFY